MIHYSAAVAAARAARRPIVALESSVLAQGLPIPHNRAAAERMLAAVTEAGAVPAVAAVVRGVPMLGLDGDDLERFLRRDGIKKVSARDLAVAVTRKEDGATTVAATLAIAGTAGIPVFATGGIGGVHREAPYDESADLVELSRTSMVVVCAGAKSILDLSATMERLESLGVPVIGYRCDELPGFFTRETGITLSARVDSVEEIASIFQHHVTLGRSGSVVVVQSPPASTALDSRQVHQAVGAALAEGRRLGITGPALTPFLLGAVDRATGGKSLVANLALLEANARLGGEIAAAIASEEPS